MTPDDGVTAPGGGPQQASRPVRLGGPATRLVVATAPGHTIPPNTPGKPSTTRDRTSVTRVAWGHRPGSGPRPPPASGPPPRRRSTAGHPRPAPEPGPGRCAGGATAV